jgi:hypothetical protein
MTGSTMASIPALKALHQQLKTHMEKAEPQASGIASILPPCIGMTSRVLLYAFRSYS